ncbi:MAG: serine hydrolase [Lentimicrobiaceae bacterium]|nr:serine hydrolase [Lentimicrobiaceae bacterium]
MKKFLIFPLFTLMLSMLIASCDKEEAKPTVDASSIATPADLTAVLNDICSHSDAPGMAVSIVINDTLLYQQSFGKADINRGKPYSNQTTQPIGSISKTFVAAAIVKAIEQGYFTLETNINEILPVELINPKMPNAVIQVKHLVTHTSGLLDEVGSYFQAYHIVPGEDLTTEGAQLLVDGFGIQHRESRPLEDFLASYYYPEGDLYSLENFASSIPGSSWNYSNIATSLAAYLVEKATGIPFHRYVSINILQPLGMTSTSYDPADLDPTGSAQLYWDKNTALPRYANDSYPDGSIHTCNEDLAKFLLDMMKGAKGQSATLFSAAGYKMLFEALLPEGMLPVGLAENQSVFWFLGGNEIKHDGSDPGTSCNLQFDKEGNTGYFLLTNMDASSDIHDQAYFELAGKVHIAVSAFIQHQ